MICDFLLSNFQVGKVNEQNIKIKLFCFKKRSRNELEKIEQILSTEKLNVFTHHYWGKKIEINCNN